MSKPFRPEDLPDFTEKKLEGDMRYLGRIISVEDDVVELPDGKMSAREVVRHPGAAVILPVLDGGEIVMVWQYRYPIGRHSLEFPAGKLEKGEKSVATAGRELLEETGYVAGSLEKVMTLHSSVGFCDEELDVFLATNLRHEGSEGVDGEFVHVVKLAVEEALAAVEEGSITDSKTMASIFWLREKLGKA